MEDQINHFPEEVSIEGEESSPSIEATPDESYLEQPFLEFQPPVEDKLLEGYSGTPQLLDFSPDVDPSPLFKGYSDSEEQGAGIARQGRTHIDEPVPVKNKLAASYTFTVEGFEATQGTQFYKSSRHMHTPHSEPDNAVPLIKRKHLAIRVYPNLNKQWWVPAGKVYGDVWFKRIDIADSYKKAVKLNQSTTGRRATTINRGNGSHTLNFRISDLYTQGTLLIYTRCRAYISGSWRYTPWFNRTFTFTTVPSIRIRAHGIHYHRNGIVKAAPVLSDFIATGVYLRKTYPMSRFNFLSYDVIHFSGDLTNTAGGGCGQGWNALWDLLRSLYNSSGRDANHYALMKKGIPTAFGGCGGGNVGASFVGDGSVMAQELGHGLGRGHAPGCGAGGPDPSYPHYTHPRTGTIGEFGMDYATGKIYNPSNSTDFMGYCGNRWVSPYTYRSLISGINDQPSASPSATEAVDSENRRFLQEHLYLNFLISCNGVVELQSGLSLVGPGGSATGEPTDHSVEVHDEKNNVLWAKRLTLEEAHQDHDDSHTRYSEAIPMLEGARKLVFKCGRETTITEIDIPEQIPEIVLKPLKLSKGKPQSGKIKLDWTAECANSEKITSIVRYSNDGGETWRPVIVGLNSSEFEVDLDQLPGGNDCRFQVLATTVLRTTAVETQPFSVTKTLREAMISPIQQSTEDANPQLIELAGCAYSPDGCADEEDCRWYSSLDGDLGIGEHLMANNLTPGEHIISLIAPDGGGGETRANYTVRIYTKL